MVQQVCSCCFPLHQLPHTQARHLCCLFKSPTFLLPLPAQVRAPHTLPSMAVVELKVGMHCEKCIKAIKKAIKKIEEIETYRVDTELNKITVTGSVTTQEVIRVLQKIGKHATNWNEETTDDSPSNKTS